MLKNSITGGKVFWLGLGGADAPQSHPELELLLLDGMGDTKGILKAGKVKRRDVQVSCK